MSVFKDKAIVLKIEKTREKDLLYTFFTYEY
ncbi:MAG: recombination protein O N-terminal domain-containing protein [Candidatus Peribacteria bacterium]|nr:recombination protein O N-terminal domain-containing protein [Candidatus Peribacteria bacterium]